jgi:hypothetical protein
MKILFVSTDFPFKSEKGTINQGGGGACIAQLAEGLAKKGLEIEVGTRTGIRALRLSNTQDRILQSGFSGEQDNPRNICDQKMQGYTIKKQIRHYPHP